jgi:hypothetical protein
MPLSGQGQAAAWSDPRDACALPASPAGVLPIRRRASNIGLDPIDGNLRRVRPRACSRHRPVDDVNGGDPPAALSEVHRLSTPVSQPTSRAWPAGSAPAPSPSSLSSWGTSPVSHGVNPIRYSTG